MIAGCLTPCEYAQPNFNQRSWPFLKVLGKYSGVVMALGKYFGVIQVVFRRGLDLNPG